MTANIDIIRATYEGETSEENGRQLARYLAPDARWFEAAGFPYAGEYVGFDAIKTGVFARLAEEWENYRFLPERFLGDGDTVVVIGEYRGRYRATDKAFQARVCHLWQLKDQQIVQFEQVVDSVPVRDAMEP